MGDVSHKGSYKSMGIHEELAHEITKRCCFSLEHNSRLNDFNTKHKSGRTSSRQEKITGRRSHFVSDVYRLLKLRTILIFVYA